MDNEKTKLFAILLRRICDDVADFANNLYRLADDAADEENSELDTLPHLMPNDDEKVKAQGCQAVDLGLPSGLKWADRNVGAESPEDFGDYFMWGSTVPDTNNPCNWANAPFNGGAIAFNETYFDSVKDTVCPGGVLASEHDAAHVIMGGNWRMPTSVEMWELLDGTTRSAETLNGVKGMRFTSKANGNSIFMPFAGYRYGSEVNSVGNSGDAWSSSLCAGGAYYYSRDILFDDIGDASITLTTRYCGLVVRGVHV